MTTSITTTGINSLIQVGKRYLDDGSLLEITHLQGQPGNQIIRFREVKGGNTRHLSEERFKERLEAERLVPIEDAMDTADFSKVILGLSKRDYSKFAFKCGVTRIADSTLPGMRTDILMAEVEAFCERFNRQAVRDGLKPRKIPHYKTVNRWLNEYRAAGDYFVFAKRDHRARLRKKQFSPAVEALIDQVITDDFANSQRPNVSASYDELLRQARVLLPEAKLGTSKKTRLPSEATFRRRIAASDQFHILKRRYGAEHVRKNLNYGGKTHTAEYIGGRVEIDCQRCDVLVKHPRTKKLYRPWLMVFLDVYTRCVLAWEFSLAAPTGYMTTRTYQRCITSDDYPYRAIPAVLVPDQGAEFINDATVRQVSVFNTVFQPTPPQSPNGKPYIERFFRTMNDILFHKLAGTTFSSPKDRGDYPSEKKAKYSIREIETLFSEALEVYHHSVHRGLGHTPHQHWKHALKDGFRPPRTVRAEDALLLGMKLEKSEITKGHVELYGLKWSSPGLPELKRRLLERGCKHVEVRVNPNNLERVWVCDDRKPSEVFSCDAYLPEYQRNLTLDEHEAIAADKKFWRKISGCDENARILRADFQARLRSLNHGELELRPDGTLAALTRDEKNVLKDAANQAHTSLEQPKDDFIEFNDDDDLMAI